MKIQIDLEQIPGFAGWLAHRWVSMHPGLAMLGQNDLGLWLNDKKGSTHLVPWKDVLAAVLGKIVQEGKKNGRPVRGPEGPGMPRRSASLTSRKVSSRFRRR